ncbi:hypothetical protein [Anaerotardibacter muris]|uniref:hypothetical protein n=1 Tax=Anaerotardibacter muris TaxID=2941505 RepID=UPI00203C72BE|nr:hypothetical protein [Anaerotardibacter muris]
MSLDIPETSREEAARREHEKEQAKHEYDVIEKETHHVSEQAHKDANEDGYHPDPHRVSFAEKAARDENNIKDHEIAETVNTTLRDE